MFICGCEEPIQINEMLYGHNDRPIGVDYELSSFTDSRLNRYSFVWFSADWDWNVDAFTHLLTAILRQRDIHLTWVQRRKYSPLASEQFETEGWATCHDDALIVATKRPSSILQTFATPHFGRDLWLFLLLGTAPSPEVFLRPPLRASVEAMYPRLRPSRHFLAWLAENDYTIGYLANDDLNRPGLVVAGTQRIDVERLLAEGTIRGIEAIPSDVWRKSPSVDLRHYA